MRPASGAALISGKSAFHGAHFIESVASPHISGKEASKAAGLTPIKYWRPYGILLYINAIARSSRWAEANQAKIVACFDNAENTLH